VTHYNWHNLLSGPNHCTTSVPQNDRAVSSEDFDNINAFLKDYCGYKGKIEAQYTLQQQNWNLSNMQDQMVHAMKQQTNNITLLYDQSHGTVIIAASHSKSVNIAVTALLFCICICICR